MQLDFSRDYLVWDNTVAVTVQSRRAASGPKAAVPVAKRRGILGKELSASGGVYSGDDVVFLLPAVLLPPGWALKPADVVTDDLGAAYTVLGADLLKNRQTWKLTTRDLVLAYDLRDAVDIERAAITYDAAGAALKAFPTAAAPGLPTGGTVLYARLPARVQLLTQEVVDERGLRGFKGTHAVIVGDQVSITNEDRIRWGSVYLDIVGLHNPERVDELPVIDAELRP